MTRPDQLRIAAGDIEVIRRTFGPKISLPQLAAQLARDLILIGSVPVHIECIEGWWLVLSEKDWLREPDGNASMRNFQHIVHFPEAGREACRSEIALTAFADAVVTRATSGELTWVTNDQNQWTLPAIVLQRMMQNSTGRTVAFTSRTAV